MTVCSFRHNLCVDDSYTAALTAALKSIVKRCQLGGYKFGDRLWLAWMLGLPCAVFCASILVLICLVFLSGFVSKVSQPCCTAVLAALLHR
jgi:hypothetical protein